MSSFYLGQPQQPPPQQSDDPRAKLQSHSIDILCLFQTLWQDEIKWLDGHLHDIRAGSKKPKGSKSAGIGELIKTPSRKRAVQQGKKKATKSAKPNGPSKLALKDVFSPVDDKENVVLSTRVGVPPSTSSTSINSTRSNADKDKSGKGSNNHKPAVALPLSHSDHNLLRSPAPVAKDDEKKPSEGERDGKGVGAEGEDGSGEGSIDVCEESVATIPEVTMMDEDETDRLPRNLSTINEGEGDAGEAGEREAEDVQMDDEAGDTPLDTIVEVENSERAPHGSADQPMEIDATESDPSALQGQSDEPPPSPPSKSADASQGDTSSTAKTFSPTMTDVPSQASQTTVSSSVSHEATAPIADAAEVIVSPVGASALTFSNLARSTNLAQSTRARKPSTSALPPSPTSVFLSNKADPTRGSALGIASVGLPSRFGLGGASGSVGGGLGLSQAQAQSHYQPYSLSQSTNALLSRDGPTTAKVDDHASRDVQGDHEALVSVKRKSIAMQDPEDIFAASSQGKKVRGTSGMGVQSRLDALRSKVDSIAKNKVASETPSSRVPATEPALSTASAPPSDPAPAQTPLPSLENPSQTDVLPDKSEGPVDNPTTEDFGTRKSLAKASPARPVRQDTARPSGVRLERKTSVSDLVKVFEERRADEADIEARPVGKESYRGERTLDNKAQSADAVPATTTPPASPPKHQFRPITHLEPIDDEEEAEPDVEDGDDLEEDDEFLQQPGDEVDEAPMEGIEAGPQTMFFDAEEPEAALDEEEGPQLPGSFEATIQQPKMVPSASGTLKPEATSVEATKSIPIAAETAVHSQPSAATSALGGVISQAASLLSKSFSKKTAPPVKSLQLAAAAAKREQEERERKAAKEEREKRRLAALQKRQDQDRQKIEDERRAKVEEAERQVKQRDDVDKHKPKNKEESSTASKDPHGAPLPKVKAATKSKVSKTEEQVKKKKLDIVKQKEAKVNPIPIASRQVPANVVESKSSVPPSVGAPITQIPKKIPKAPERVIEQPASGRLGSSAIASTSKIALSTNTRIPEARQVDKQPTADIRYQAPGATSARPTQQAESSAQAAAAVPFELPEIDSEYSDSDEEEHMRKEKKLPTWAQSPALREALQLQSTVNPDHIFGQVQPLQMEEIFRNKATAERIKKRTSSANWNGSDRLRISEEYEYARRMGFEP